MARPHALAALPEPEPTPPAPAPQTPRELQAAVEGVTVADRIEFMGDSYRVADKVGAIPYMRFAKAASRGANLEDMDGMAAVYDMLRDVFVLVPACSKCEACRKGEPCLAEDLGDWPRFEDDATRKKAEAEELINAITQAIEIMSARPTLRPSDSSAGPSTITPSSTGSSSSPVIPDGQVTEKLYTVDDLIKQAGA